MTAWSKPSIDVDYFDSNNGTEVPPIILVSAGAIEVFFGTYGFCVGLFQFLFDRGSPRITLWFILLQTTLGWIVFTTFVLVQPIRTARFAPGVDGILTPREHRIFLLMGHLLGSINFCLALQGGQFVMATRLYVAQRRDPEYRGLTVVRAMLWSFNVLVAAISTLYVGSLLDTKGFSSSTMPIAAPPHVVWYPRMSIVTGLVMLAYGVAGCMAARNKQVATNVLPVMWIIVTVTMMINFSWTFGIVPGLGPPIPGSAQHAGLVMSVTILPLYYSWRAHYMLQGDGRGRRGPSTIVQPAIIVHRGAEQSLQPKQPMPAVKRYPSDAVSVSEATV